MGPGKPSVAARAPPAERTPISPAPPSRARIHALAAGLAGPLLPAGALGAVTVVYGGAGAADAISDGTARLEGLDSALRQAPIADDRRRPPARLLGEVSGRKLATVPTAQAMAAALREGATLVTVAGRRLPVGGGVGVDEIPPGRWSAEAAARRRGALASRATTPVRLVARG